MNTRIKALIGAAVVVGAIAGIAYATPIVNLASPLLSSGQHLASMRAQGSGHTMIGHPFSVSFETWGPASIATQDGAYAANGVNGWHSHPGMVIVTMISGQIEWFDEHCNKTQYGPGDSWVEGSDLHAFRVIGKTGIHLNATFITAHNASYRTDETAPPCAAAIGLN